MILAGDVGGTFTRMALFEKGKLVGQERTFHSCQYANLIEIAAEFLQSEKGKVAKACFGVAGAVRDGFCKATNLPWIIDADRLAKALLIPSVYLLNDLEANAHGLKALQPEAFYVLNKGKRQTGNQALIAAGTGLGEAGLYWDGKTHRPFACEGGHTDFGPRNAMEIELLLYLKKKFGHVSYERIVSGPGLHCIFQFLIETGKETFSARVRAEMEKQDPSKVISEWGIHNKDPACSLAVDWFVSLYGAEAGNVALKFLSLGGLYVGGGIAPQLIEKIKSGSFFSSFVDKGRFTELLSSIPISIVLNDRAALLGAALYAEER